MWYLARNCPSTQQWVIEEAQLWDLGCLFSSCVCNQLRNTRLLQGYDVYGIPSLTSLGGAFRNLHTHPVLLPLQRSNTQSCCQFWLWPASGLMTQHGAGTAWEPLFGWDYLLSFGLDWTRLLLPLPCVSSPSALIRKIPLTGLGLPFF